MTPSGILCYAISYGPLIVAFIVSIIYVYLKYSHGYWKRKGAEFIKPSVPFGNIAKIFDGKSHLADVFKELYDQIQGAYAGIYRFHSPAIMLKDPHLIKQILVKDSNNFHDRGIYTDLKRDPLAGHLFRLTGQRWKKLRIKLSPTFTSGKVKMMFPILIHQGEQLQQSLKESASKFDLIEAKDICLKYTLDVINSVAFGIETNSFENPDNEMRLFVQEFFDRNNTFLQGIINSLAFSMSDVLNFLGLRIFNQRLTDFMFKILRDIINHRESNKVTRNDFLQLLIQLKNKGEVTKEDDAGDKSVYDGKAAPDVLSFEELAAQAFVFLLAGFETSAATMSCALYKLALHPDIQKRVQQEIEEVLAKHGGKFSYESVSEMEYLAMVISETLRMYPPLAFLSRIAEEDYLIPDSDIMLKKGTQLFISLTGLHFDPNNFPDPLKFDPERFSTENKDNIKQYTYMPFGEGPRNCIGMRMGKMQTRVGLAMILHKYTFCATPETPKQLTPKYGHILFSSNEAIKLKVTPRG